MSFGISDKIKRWFNRENMDMSADPSPESPGGGTPPHEFRAKSFVRRKLENDQADASAARAEADLVEAQQAIKGEPDPDRPGTRATQQIFDRGIGSGRIQANDRDEGVRTGRYRTGA